MTEPAQLHETHPDIIKRLKRADGHLKGIIEMIEAGRPCLDCRPAVARSRRRPSPKPSGP